MEIKDSKLEKYIANMKKNIGTDSKKAVTNYESALTRLNLLKTRYNNLTELESESDSEQEETIEDLMQCLNELKETLEQTDLKKLIQSVSVYKKKVAKLESMCGSIQNKFYEVEENNESITIKKINLDKLL